MSWSSLDCVLCKQSCGLLWLVCTVHVNYPVLGEFFFWTRQVIICLDYPISWWWDFVKNKRNQILLLQFSSCCFFRVNCVDLCFKVYRKFSVKDYSAQQRKMTRIILMIIQQTINPLLPLYILKPPSFLIAWARNSWEKKDYFLHKLMTLLGGALNCLQISWISGSTQKGGGHCWSWI